MALVALCRHHLEFTVQRHVTGKMSVLIVISFPRIREQSGCAQALTAQVPSSQVFHIVTCRKYVPVIAT